MAMVQSAQEKQRTQQRLETMQKAAQMVYDRSQMDGSDADPVAMQGQTQGSGRGDNLSDYIQSRLSHRSPSLLQTKRSNGDMTLGPNLSLIHI